jgi:PAS domain-containing protein
MIRPPGATSTACAAEQTSERNTFILRARNRGLLRKKQGFNMGLSTIGDDNTGIESPSSSVASSCQGIMNVIPAAAYMCDASGLITYFNPLAATIWGRAPKLRDAGERFCGSHQLYSADGAPIRHDECWMALALLEGTAYLGREIMIERHDGSRSVGEAYAHPLRNEQGQIVGAVTLVADITGLRGDGAGNSVAHHPSSAHSATVAMINVALSILTLMTWKNVTFN